METIGDYISFIFLLVFGIWIGSLIHTYYMKQILSELNYLKQILSELKKLNQGTPSDPKTIPIPPKPIIKGSLMYCSDCDTGYPGDRTDCPLCGGTNRYLKN
jgi:hypothetical protein